MKQFLTLAVLIILIMAWTPALIAWNALPVVAEDSPDKIVVITAFPGPKPPPDTDSIIPYPGEKPPGDGENPLFKKGKGKNEPIFPWWWIFWL